MSAQQNDYAELRRYSRLFSDKGCGCPTCVASKETIEALDELEALRDVANRQVLMCRCQCDACQALAGALIEMDI